MNSSELQKCANDLCLNTFLPNVSVKKRYCTEKCRNRHYNRLWVKKHPEKHNETMKRYYRTHKSKPKQKIPLLKQIEYRRSLIRQAIMKYLRTGKIMVSRKYNLDYEKIIEHLKPFPQEINKWSIDHIRPLASFDITIESEIDKAFEPNNLQWMTFGENVRKGSLYNGKKYVYTR